MIKKKTVKKLGRQTLALALVTSVTFTGLSLDTMAQSIKTRKETAREVQAQNKIKNKKSEPAVVKELEDLKTANSSTYLLSDGSRKLQIYATDIRYKENGEFTDYNPDLKEISKSDKKKLKESIQGSSITEPGDINNYAYVNTAGDAKQYFPEALDESSSVFMQKDNYSIAFTPVWNHEKEADSEAETETKQENTESAQDNKEAEELTETQEAEQSETPLILTGETDGTQITYTDESENIEYKYTSLPQGVKEDIILNEKPQTNEFVFKLCLEGMKAELNEESKEIELTDKKTKEKAAVIAAPNIMDGDGNLCYEDVSYELAGDILKIIVKEEYFENENLKYPVTIDPTAVWFSSGLLPTSRVNSMPINADKNNQTSEINVQNQWTLPGSRDYTYMDTSSISSGNAYLWGPAYIENTYIEAAYIEISEKSSIYSTHGTVQIMVPEESWDPKTITWNNQPEIENRVWGEISATGKDRTRHTVDMTEWAQAVATGEIGNNGLVFMAKEQGTGAVFYGPQQNYYYENGSLVPLYMWIEIRYRNIDKYDGTLSMSAEYDSEENTIDAYLSDFYMGESEEAEAEDGGETEDDTVYEEDEEDVITQYKVFRRLSSEDSFKCVSVCNSQSEKVSIPATDTEEADFRISVAYKDGTAKLSNIVTLKKKTENETDENGNQTTKITYEQITTDTDGDGLEDGYEIWDLKTKWKDKDANGNYITDSDGDGFPDGYEVFMLGTDPAVVTPKNNDPDNDGATDWEETLQGTDPHCSDSDFDGKVDGNTDESNPRWTNGGTDEMTAYNAEIYIGPYNRTYTETVDGITYTYIQSIYSGEIRSVKAAYGNELLDTENRYFYDEKHNLTAIVEIYNQKLDNGTTRTRAICKTYAYDNDDKLIYICDQKTKYTMDYDSDGEMANLYVGGQKLVGYTQSNEINNEDSNGNTDHLELGALIKEDKNITTYGNGNKVQNAISLFKVPETETSASGQSISNTMAAKIETSYNNSNQNSYVSEYNNDGNLLKLSDYTTNASNPVISTFTYTDNGMSMVRNDGFAKTQTYTEDETDNTSTTDISYTFDDVKGDSITYNTTDMAGVAAKDGMENETGGSTQGSTEEGEGTDNTVSAKKLYNNDVIEHAYDIENDITTNRIYSTLFDKYIISYTQTKNEESDVTTYGIDNLTDDKELEYTYDLRGNITQVKINGAVAYKYEYDGHGRLVNEKGYRERTETLYLYNGTGNLYTKRTYAFVNGQRGAAAQEVTGYTYDEKGNWPDQLKTYKGQSITYDDGGNPLVYRDGMNFTWDRGRSLEGITFNNGTQATYRYNESGLRTYKDTQYETATYEWDGTTLLRETVTYKSQNRTYDIWYYYDTMGNITGFEYSYVNDYNQKVRNAVYYEKDLQGNVIGLMDSRGAELATYSYDAWGNVTSKVVYQGYEIIESLNHIGYRGYYRDTESGFYYLQSRYYDAQTGRFINADDVGVLGIEGSSMFKDNLYVYCNGDPVNYVDPNGYYAETLTFDKSIITLLSGALAGIIAGISASMASVKAAIATSWLPAVCIAAAAVAIAGIVYTVNKVKALSASAASTVAAVKAKVVAQGVNPKKLGKNTVYVIYRNGTTDVVYVGRTCNYSARKSAHQRKRFSPDKYTMIPIATNLTLAQARALEQTIITAYTLDTLKNMINSISPKKWRNFKTEFSQMQTLIESFYDPE